jgi:hypothetical protein
MPPKGGIRSRLENDGPGFMVLDGAFAQPGERIVEGPWAEVV